MQRKKRKKRKSAKGDYSLVKIIPLASSNSDLAKVLGGVEVITKGAFTTSPIFAKTSAQELPS
jgi:hypothetical protein